MHLASKTPRIITPQERSKSDEFMLWCRQVSQLNAAIEAARFSKDTGDLHNLLYRLAEVEKIKASVHRELQEMREQ
jgi:hypothetical protein